MHIRKIKVRFLEWLNEVSVMIQVPNNEDDEEYIDHFFEEALGERSYMLIWDFYD